MRLASPENRFQPLKSLKWQLSVNSPIFRKRRSLGRHALTGDRRRELSVSPATDAIAIMPNVLGSGAACASVKAVESNGTNPVPVE